VTARGFAMTACPAPPAVPAAPAGRVSGCVSLALSREVACIRSLAWRTDLPTRVDWGALGAALEAAGLTRLAPVGRMQRFGSGAGDEIALVPVTGRVQLRVHYSIPEHDRRFAAERLFQLVVHALLRA
jgi:hypothetical protein